MPKLKSHKTVEQIAKKHRLDVSFIQKQLDMGEPIEHEHTKDHELAMDIALQHLDEIPDYYTRLKKMEASAKKEHKKFKDVKESSEEQRYCPLCDKREGRSECSYGGKAWDKVSVKDQEYSMARSELDTLVKAAERIKKKVGKGEGSLEAWVQSKITKAADYIDTAADYIDGGEMEEQITVRKGILKGSESQVKRSTGAGALTPPAAQQLGPIAIKLQKKRAAAVSLPKLKEEKLVDKILRELQEASTSGDDDLGDWFRKSSGTDPKTGKKVPGWVQLGGEYAGAPCAKQPGQTTKPKCGSSKMAAEMSPEEEERAARRKRKEDPNPERVGKAINVATEEFVDEDACKEKVKSRYKVWPSAYASGALVKCRKVGAANWGNKTKNEDVTIEDANGNLQAEIFDLITPDPIKSPKSTFMANNSIDETTRLQAENGNIIAVVLSWRAKTYSIRMFFPQASMPSKKDVTTEIQKVYPGAQVLQFNASGIQPGMPLIQVVNSKSKNYLLNNGTIGEDWQSANRKDKTDGMSRETVKKYRQENPDSKLQTAVTEKNPSGKRADRRKSFCSRMKGHKAKNTSAETARDPDSRINKALRRWNCN
jgi:hypothetical protein